MSSNVSHKAFDYWNRQADSFDAIYTGAKPSWARLLDHWLRMDMYKRFDWVMLHSGKLEGRTVCDLGCGTGRYVIACALAGAKKVVGIDGAPRMIEKASSVVAQVGCSDRCELRAANIQDCPTNEMFDVTLAVGVFDYVADPSPFLARIRQITGQRFLATFPRLWTWRMPVRKIRLGLLGCPVYFYTPRRIEKLLRAAGFTCKRIDRVGEIFCVLSVPSSFITISAHQDTTISPEAKMERRRQLSAPAGAQPGQRQYGSQRS